MRAAVDIVAASCVFPSGPSLPLADAAIRSGLVIRHRHPFYVDRSGGNIRSSCFHDDPREFNAHRWCEFARRALAELSDGLSLHPDLSNSERHLWLVLPDGGRAGVPPGVAEALAECAPRSAWTWSSVTAVRGGHAVGVHALRQARDACRRSDVLAVVLAVDGWLHQDALAWMEAQRLLHGACARHEGVLRANPYGRVPGEGAAAVALYACAARNASLGRLLGAAVASEPVQTTHGVPCLGRTLTEAALEAMTEAGPAIRLIGRISSDLTAEPSRADELGFATLRLSDRLLPGWTRATPAAVSGDIGAASSILQLALASYGMRRQGSSETARQLILCSSDDPLRAAIVIGPPAGARDS